eukprot:CFRG4475T1
MNTLNCFKIVVWIFLATSIAFAVSSYLTHYHIVLYEDYESKLNYNWLLAENGDFDAYDQIAICPTNRSDDIRIACLGDAITSGNGSSHPGTSKEIYSFERGNYPIILESMLRSRFSKKNITVRNYGRSGAQILIAGADIPYFQTKEHMFAISYRPNVVVLMLGTNDSKVKIWNNALRDQFIKNLATLLMSLSYKYGCRPKLWLMIPPPILEDNFELNGQILRNEVNPLLRDVIAPSSRSNMPIIDNESVLGEDIMKNFYLKGTKGEGNGNGVYPCIAGTTKIAEAVYAVVESWIAALPIKSF